MPSWFRKELFSRPIHLPTGHTVPFVEVADDMGVLATDDGYIIAELRKLIERQVGGVTEINAVEYEELKKNPPAGPSPPPFLSQDINQFVVRTRNAAEGSRMAPLPPSARESVPLTIPKTIPLATPAPVIAKAGRKAGSPAKASSESQPAAPALE